MPLNGTPRAPRRPSVERTCLFCGGTFRCKASDGFQCCSRPCSEALKRSVTPLQRLQAKTSVSGNCWLWTGLRDKDGYGKTSIDKVSIRTHRLAWLAATGHMPTADEGIFHTCDVPACWRNDEVGTYEVGGIIYERHGHLWLGTNAANMADRDAKGHTTKGDAHWMRTNPEKIKRGDNHPSRLYPEKRPKGDQHWTRSRPGQVLRGEKSGRAVLTESMVREIRWRRANGERVAAIARLLGVSEGAVRAVIDGRSWAHLQ